MQEACDAILKDESFRIGTPAADFAMKTASALSTWITEHKDSAKIFEQKLVVKLQECVDKALAASGKMHSDRIWTAYHTLRTSDVYVCDWQCIIEKAGLKEGSAICFQCIGDFILKKLIKTTYPVTITKAHMNSTLTYEETNAVRYAAGFVLRTMKKNIEKSMHAHKADLLLCLAQLLDTGDAEVDESKDWLEIVDRGGLCHVSNDTFEVFLAMEKELRKILATNVIQQLDDTVKTKLAESDGVQFIWYIICADWDEHISQFLLQSMIKEWVKIRGFSLAGAWVEKYKAANKKSTQKTKGLRKQMNTS